MRAWNLALVGAAVGCGDKEPSASNQDAVVVLGDTGLFDVDGDGYTAAEDCDDEDAGIHPGAEEVCDGVDNDCDDEVDEDATAWYADSDGDGYGDAGSTTVACDEPSGYVSDDTDCDDADAGANPGEDEVCDGDDDDCDGLVDESDAIDAGTWYTDADGDGYGDEDSGVTDCTQPSGTISTGGDCLDTDDTVYPGDTEVCGDGVVNDCDSSESAADAACDDWGSTVSTGDAGAVFTATTTNWFMGINPAPVGDVNGDGVADVLLGSSLGSPGGVSEAGSTHLFHGPVSGTLPLSTADVIVAGRRSYDNAASSGAGLGDLDGTATRTSSSAGRARTRERRARARRGCCTAPSRARPSRPTTCGSPAARGTPSSARPARPPATRTGTASATCSSGRPSMGPTRAPPVSCPAT
jgi:hypothetical protein